MLLYTNLTFTLNTTLNTNKMEKTGFFESSPGKKSSTRLQMFITMLFAFAVVGFQVYSGKVDIVLTILLFTAAFAPKQVQNISEKVNLK